VNAALKAETKALKDWIIEAALPFWAAHGVDAQCGFYEDLHLDRTANVDAIRRVRVQSRQIFVYSLASQRGWYDGVDVADKCYDFLETYGYQRDGENDARAGYAHRIGPNYNVVAPMRDFYDHAFHLLGATSLAGLSGAKNQAAARGRCEDILGFIDVELEAPNKGWLESSPATLPRRQNPHMHYLEASLALYQRTGDTRHLQIAHKIFDLFQLYFYDAQNAVISEFFNLDWSLAAGDVGQTAEPGHAVEWVWLLGQYEKFTGVLTRGYQEALYDKAFIGNPLFLNDEEEKTGQVRRATKRLWVQTEVVRAHLTMARLGHAGAEQSAARALAGLREHYLNNDGTWVDQLDEYGRPCATTIPVSTFYHIMGMAIEAVDFCEG
jgi:mannose-6-phosphate isomerase